jgi:hypothetical protein
MHFLQSTHIKFLEFVLTEFRNKSNYVRERREEQVNVAALLRISVKWMRTKWCIDLSVFRLHETSDGATYVTQGCPVLMTSQAKMRTHFLGLWSSRTWTRVLLLTLIFSHILSAWVKVFRSMVWPCIQWVQQVTFVGEWQFNIAITIWTRIP